MAYGVVQPGGGLEREVVLRAEPDATPRDARPTGRRRAVRPPQRTLSAAPLGTSATYFPAGTSTNSRRAAASGSWRGRPRAARPITGRSSNGGISGVSTISPIRRRGASSHRSPSRRLAGQRKRWVSTWETTPGSARSLTASASDMCREVGGNRRVVDQREVEVHARPICRCRGSWQVSAAWPSKTGRSCRSSRPSRWWS